MAGKRGHRKKERLQAPACDDFALALSSAFLRKSIARSLAIAFDRAQQHYGLTQKDIAQRAGCDASQVSRWLKGGNWEMDTIAKLAAALDHRAELQLTAMFDDGRQIEAPSGWVTNKVERTLAPEADSPWMQTETIA